MTEREFDELRQFAGLSRYAVDLGYKPPASLIRKGWLRHVIDNFYAITPAGSAALEAMRKGVA